MRNPGPAIAVSIFNLLFIGFLESLDDFYTLGSKIVVLQTTNNVFNNSLYDAVQPNSLFSWHRMRLANFLASNGKEWAQMFSRYNSGELIIV